jgi:hypothetical protein
VGSWKLIYKFGGFEIMSRKENIEKKLSTLTCQDKSEKYYSALSTIYKTDNIMLASDGKRAAMYFSNNNSDSYKYLSEIENPNINVIQKAIQIQTYDSQVEINREVLKDIITAQMDDIKAQYKPHYNYHKDLLKLTTRLSFNILENALHVDSHCHLTEFVKGTPVCTHMSFDSFQHSYLPIFIYRTYMFNNKIINITFDTQFLIDMINFHTEETLQIMISDDKLGVTPIMSIQSDRLMLLIPCRPNPKQEGDE